MMRDREESIILIAKLMREKMTMGEVFPMPTISYKVRFIFLHLIQNKGISLITLFLLDHLLSEITMRILFGPPPSLFSCLFALEHFPVDESLKTNSFVKNLVSLDSFGQFLEGVSFSPPKDVDSYTDCLSKEI
ncbi:hypothetical protein Ancab_004334 [Ancistrocladus abbreviatus]